MSHKFKIPTSDFNFLKNTIWIVPPSTLLAYEITSYLNTPVVDQTIWVINEVNNNYFFGKAYTNINGTYSTSTINGSITSDFSVYATFQNTIGYITGIGNLYCKKYFTMQMSTTYSLLNPTYYIHASYMIQTTKKNKSYYKLPGSKTFNTRKYLSVDEFIANCPT